MIVYPAMDLMGGRCVRLTQGRFDEASIYASDPAEALDRFNAAGAEWAHIVDLDGARAGEPVQHDLIANLAKVSKLKLQAGGGFRTRDQVARMLDSGVGRVVIGSLSVDRPDRVQAFVDEFGGEAVSLALDVSCKWGTPLVVIRGWTETTRLTVYDVAASFFGGRHLLVTDVGRDGMLLGPNLSLVSELVHYLPGFALQASGGIATIEDVRKLAATGAAGTVVGKALWEGRLDLAEAIEIAGA